MAMANDRGEAPSEPITVEITAGPVAGEVVSKRSQKVTVGRTKKSHVAIKDSAVSQKHAEFRWTGCWCLTDCGSSNGTFLNGEQISEDEMRPLSEGDEILFGEESVVKVSFKEPGSGAMTVEDYLRTLVGQLADAARDGVEQHVKELWDEFLEHKRKVLDDNGIKQKA